MSATIRFGLKTGVDLIEELDQPPQLIWDGVQLTFNRAKIGAVAALRTLSTSKPTKAELTEIVVSHDGGLGIVAWQKCLHQLEQHALLERTLYYDGNPLATLFIHSEFFRFRQAEIDMDQSYILSRFAHIRRIDEDIVLTSPLGYASLKIAPELFTLISKMYQPVSINQLSKTNGLDIETLTTLFCFLMNAELMSVVYEWGNSYNSQDKDLEHWEFHNLVFHANAQDGRSLGKIGATYRLKDKYPIAPAIREPYPSPPIPLAKPDHDAILKTDPTLFETMETRRSSWDYDEENPITIEQLGVFLYRVGRIKKQFHTKALIGEEAHTFHLAQKPYPSGGSLYPLEIYPVIRNCDGLESNIYHYEPLNHTLHPIPSGDKKFIRLLDEGSPGLTHPNPPQILLLITARFQRTMWKYEGLSYALLLKECGVLYQSMYLIVTAMGLGVCGLGGCNPDLWEQSDYFTEGAIGAVAIGNPPPR